jgi:hypothetical protein
MSFFTSHTFNAAEVAPRTGFDPIPDGTYEVFIVKAEEKPTQKGGKQFVVQVKIADGQPYAGKSAFHRMNLICPSSTKAEEIGKGELSALCRSIGLMVPKSADEFIGKKGTVRVKVVKRQDNGEMENKIDWLFDKAAPAAAAPTATATTKAAPWKR